MEEWRGEDRENNLASYRKGKRKVLYDPHHHRRHLLPHLPAVYKIALCWWLHPKQSSQVLISLYAGHWVRYKSVSRSGTILIEAIVQCFFFRFPSLGRRFFQRAREELGRAETSSTLLVLLLVPVRLWKIASKIYCFSNASKFCALIDDAFTGAEFLPQSRTPVRDGERRRTREKGENK